MKTILKLLAAVLVLLIIVISINTVTFKHEPLIVEPAPAIELPEQAIIQRLSKAIQIKTISHEDEAKLDQQAFAEFIQFVEQSYPLVTQHLERQIINDYSLMYQWPGSDATLKPLLLMGHYDVVPVASTSLDKWQQPPFSGAIVDGKIWGRGALDDKFTVMGALEATEQLLAEGFQPKRSIFFAFGHDEEVGGENGAKLIADQLRSQGMQFEMILDEGGTIVRNGVIDGVDSPVALIGIAEKGYVNLKLTATDIGGHSSMPPPSTALGRVSQAVTRLEQSPFPANLDYAGKLFEKIGPLMPTAQKTVFANLWLTRPIVGKILSASKSSNAMVRTTTAATMSSASPKANILPDEAWVIVNFRIMPGETPESVREYVVSTIQDPTIEVAPVANGNLPSPVSKVGNLAFETLQTTIAQIENDPKLVVSPYLVVGGTDAKHYVGLSDSIYRFSFSRFTPESLGQMHGIDEQIKAKDYLDTVRFFYQLINNFQQ